MSEGKEGKKSGTNGSCYGSLQSLLGKFLYPASGHHVDGPDPHPGSHCPLAGKDFRIEVLSFQREKAEGMPRCLSSIKTSGRPDTKKA